MAPARSPRRSSTATTTRSTSSPNTPSTGPLTFDGGGLRWNAAFDLDASRAITLNAGGGTILTKQFTTTISQAITGTGGLIKKGDDGTLILTGNNLYGEATTIDGGTLLANNTTGSATGTGGVIVNSGGTLGGTGSVAGTVTINSGGTLAPGASPGTLSVDDILFGASSIFNVEIGGLLAGSEYDVLAVGNDATLAGMLEIDLFDLGGGLFSPSLGDSFEILTATNVFGEFDTVLGAQLGGGLMFDVSYGASDVTLQVVTVPEPSTGILLVLGMVSMLAGRRTAARKLNCA